MMDGIVYKWHKVMRLDMQQNAFDYCSSSKTFLAKQAVPFVGQAFSEPDVHVAFNLACMLKGVFFAAASISFVLAHVYAVGDDLRMKIHADATHRGAC